MKNWLRGIWMKSLVGDFFRFFLGRGCILVEGDLDEIVGRGFFWMNMSNISGLAYYE